ncbi:hypothetical protein [Streptomyces endophytica]|uniref:hypothetical protein n=1 Tax=Streptomyces endophytica TaxID=2991496 RepID=UPI00311B2A09
MNAEDTPDTTHPEERTRRTRLVVASMAAAVLLAGGGAAYWASSASGDGSGPDSGHGNPPPLALDGYSGGSIAAGEPNPQGAKYKAVAKLPGGPGSAPVYRPKGEVAREAVERLAKALDVAGKVRSEGSTWKVGEVTPDSRGPILQVNKTGSGSWTFSKYGTPAVRTARCPPPPRATPARAGRAAAGRRAGPAARRTAVVRTARPGTTAAARARCRRRRRSGRCGRC